MEIIDGTDRTPKVTISRANSIENRVVKLLQYLDRAHPSEGWGSSSMGTRRGGARLLSRGIRKGRVTRQ